MSTVSRTILILNFLLTNIYALEADGQDGQLPAEILADIEAKSTPEECIPFDDCLPLTEFVKFNLKNIQNETITKSDLQSYVTELSCGVRELIWDKEYLQFRIIKSYIFPTFRWIELHVIVFVAHKN